MDKKLKLIIERDNVNIAYSNSDYLLTNKLDFDYAKLDDIEDGILRSNGKKYYILSNNKTRVFKPTYNIDKAGVIKEKGKPIAYDEIFDFSNDLKVLTNDIILYKFPFKHNGEDGVEKDENGNFYQRINFIITSFGGSKDIVINDFSQYDIFEVKDEYISRKIKFDNGITIDSIKKIEGITENKFLLSVKNYGILYAWGDMKSRFYILPIQHKDNGSILCKIKFVFNIEDKILSVKMNNSFVMPKETINIKFDSDGGKYIIPIETNINELNIHNENKWIKSYVKGSSLILECDDNKSFKRNSDIIFGYKDKNYKISINQEPFVDYKIIIDKNNLKVNGDENIDIIKVCSLYGSHSIILSSEYDWIHYEIIEKNSSDKNTLFKIKIKIDKNLSYQDRNGYIKISHSDNPNIYELVNINQILKINSYDNFIEINDEFLFDYEGAPKDYEVKLFPFVDCTFSIKKKPSWMKYKINGNILTIECDKNLFCVRKSKVVIINNDFPYNPIIKTIKQKGKDS